jgi:hypothetical protein
MSNRRRITRTPQSYTARLQRRSRAGPPRRGPAARRPPPTPAWLLAALAVIGEVGHLAAAYVEWPGATARGAYHVTAGALLGLVAVVLSTGTGRRRLAAGAAIAVAGPVLWLAGSLVDASPYHQLPLPAALGVGAAEAALATLLVLGWWRIRDALIMKP